MSGVFWATALSRKDGSSADGIHLLWSAPYSAGYSLTGYDIQRRISQWKPKTTCYTLTASDLQALHREFRVATPVGEVSVQACPCPAPPSDIPDTPFEGD